MASASGELAEDDWDDFEVNEGIAKSWEPEGGVSSSNGGHSAMSLLVEFIPQ